MEKKDSKKLIKPILLEPKIDLGTKNLPELVDELNKHQLIPEHFYNQFKKNYSQNLIASFIAHFQNKSLDSFNFKNLKINIFDHRRITDILITLRPKLY